jgi:hypothetical protein
MSEAVRMTARHTVSGPRLNVNRITITEEVSVRPGFLSRTSGQYEGVCVPSADAGDHLGRRAHALDARRPTMTPVALSPLAGLSLARLMTGRH